MTGREQKRIVIASRKMSRAHAQGLADMIEHAGRVGGRWQAFREVIVGSFRIEYREDLPSGEQFEVTENGAARRRLNTLTDAVLEISELDPDLDLDSATFKVPTGL